jgi:hypothetical protein
VVCSCLLLIIVSKLHGSGLSQYSIKSLQDIYDAYPEYSSENTLILDDSPHKSAENRANALYLPSYTVSDASFVPESDTALLSVLKYFESLGDAKPLTKCLKKTPFGTLNEDQRKIRYNVMNINKNEAVFSINDKWIVSSIDETSRWTEGRPAFRPPVIPTMQALELDPNGISKTQQKRLAKLEKKEAAERERQATSLILQSGRMSEGLEKRVKKRKRSKEEKEGELDLKRKRKNRIVKSPEKQRKEKIKEEKGASRVKSKKVMVKGVIVMVAKGDAPRIRAEEKARLLAALNKSI